MGERHRYRCNIEETLDYFEKADIETDPTFELDNDPTVAFLYAEHMWREQPLLNGDNRQKFSSSNGLLRQPISAGTILVDENPAGISGTSEIYRKSWNTERWYAPNEMDVFRPGVRYPEELRGNSYEGYKISKISVLKDAFTAALADSFTSWKDEWELVNRMKNDPEGVSRDWRQSAEGRLAALFPDMVDEGEKMIKDALMETLQDKTVMAELKRRSKASSHQSTASMVEKLRRMSFGGHSFKSRNSGKSSRANTFKSQTSGRSVSDASTGARSSGNTLNSAVTAATAVTPQSRSDPFRRDKTSPFAKSFTGPPSSYHNMGTRGSIREEEDSDSEFEDEDGIPPECRSPPFAAWTTGR